MADQPNPQQDQRDQGPLPQNADAFGHIPNISADFGTVPHVAAAFRKVPNGPERSENHTLTVREVTRMFEGAGVARTERSIVNWCQRDAQGSAKLDAYYDHNERRYFITPESVNRAIEEELAKQQRRSDPIPPPVTEPFPQFSEDARTTRPSKPADPEDASLQQKIIDLTITNRVKDQVIGIKDQLITELQERDRNYVERLIATGHRIGELETQLKQLNAPDQSHVRRLSPDPNSDEDAHVQGTTI